ncbi:Chromate resistance protein ChrB [Streptomyces misionensis]
MGEDAVMQWVALIVRLPARPARHRVAVWREPRRAGALSLGQGVWAVPDAPVFAVGIRRAPEPAERAGGESVVPRAEGRAPRDATRFEAMSTAGHEEDWAEFPADCGKRTAELDKEVGKGEFIPAELEEAGQSPERLRKPREVFCAQGAEEAGRRPAERAPRFEDHGERVFAHPHAFCDDGDGGAR